jgi:hypothetical protein
MYERYENAYRIVGGKSEGRRALGRPKHRWGDKIKIECEGVSCFDLNGSRLGSIYLLPFTV